MKAILFLSLLLIVPIAIYAQPVTTECKLNLSEYELCKKDSNDYPISTTIAVIGTVIAAGGLFYTGFEQRNQRKSKYVELINDFDEQITKQEKSKARTTNYRVFAAEYLNIHEKIAHLALKKIIPKEIPIYFEASFEACLGILDDPIYSAFSKDLTYLATWCEKNNIKKGKKP